MERQCNCRARPLLILALQIYSFVRMKSTKKDARELGDDEGGIDWRENDVADPEPRPEEGLFSELETADLIPMIFFILRDRTDGHADTFFCFKVVNAD